MINQNYRRLLLSYFLLSIGDWFYRLALPLLLFKLTGSALDMSIAYALTFLPFVLVTPFGGVIADKLDRRKILIYGDLLAFLFTALLGVVATFTHTAWPLYPLIFIIASLSSLTHPAFQSILPAVVKSEDLIKANAYINSSDNIIALIGPLTGGAIIAWLGTLNTIYINAFSFLISSLLLFTLKVTLVAPTTKEKITLANVLVNLREGFRYVWGHNPVIKYGCLLFVFANFGTQFFYANFMYYLVDFLHLNPTEIGVTLALTGIGAVLGSLIAPTLGKYITPGRLIVLACTLEGLATLSLMLAKNAYYVAIAWGIASGFASITIVTYFTLRQRIVPSGYLGRSVATTRVISYSAIPIGSILGGWTLEATHQMMYLILIGGGIMTLNGLAGWFSPLNQEKAISEAMKVSET